MLTSSAMVYEAIYFATPRGAALAALIRVCQARALATHPQGLSAYAAALARARACRAGGERVEGWWALLGIGVLSVLAAPCTGPSPGGTGGTCVLSRSPTRKLPRWWSV